MKNLVYIFFTVCLFACQSEELTIISEENGSELSIVPPNSDEYLTYRVDDQMPITYFEHISCMLQPSQIVISHITDMGNGEIQEFRLEFGKAGDLPLDLGKYNVINGLRISDDHGNKIDYETTSNIEAEITTIGERVGDYVDVNFSGTFIDEVGAEHTIIGLVHAYRDN
ncbi:MAG: hypothetical protein HKN48_07230 [Flavobacteriaceae bacterium]|nr:hypothetical protein [Flavobacteriaceae bacterium]